MKETSLEALAEVLGPHKAELLSTYFQQKEANNPSDGNERAVSVGLGLFSKKN